MTRLLHQGDVWKLNAAGATIYLRLSSLRGASVKGFVAYWHPNAHQDAEAQGLADLGRLRLEVDY